MYYNIRQDHFLWTNEDVSYNIRRRRRSISSLERKERVMFDFSNYLIDLLDKNQKVFYLSIGFLLVQLVFLVYLFLALYIRIGEIWNRKP